MDLFKYILQSENCSTGRTLTHGCTTKIFLTEWIIRRVVLSTHPFLPLTHPSQFPTVPPDWMNWRKSMDNNYTHKFWTLNSLNLFYSFHVKSKKQSSTKHTFCTIPLHQQQFRPLFRHKCTNFHLHFPNLTPSMSNSHRQNTINLTIRSKQFTSPIIRRWTQNPQFFQSNQVEPRTPIRQSPPADQSLSLLHIHPCNPRFSEGFQALLLGEPAALLFRRRQTPLHFSLLALFPLLQVCDFLANQSSPPRGLTLFRCANGARDPGTGLALLDDLGHAGSVRVRPSFWVAKRQDVRTGWRIVGWPCPNRSTE